MGPEEFSRRWEAGQRLIQANGVTYNVYGDPRGSARPWPLDLIPLAIDAHEWKHIESAVIQRATLLNTILADLYGTHRLIRDGFIPPELLFANPNFLRPCHDIKPPGGVYLHNYAVDIARAPNGRWWVLSDRTQSPSGAGYALENRLVSARTLPTVLNRCRVQSIDRFFEVMIEALLALAPRRPDNPRVVVLTSGPNSETYFEHSFFARQWDFPLVGGADLTVRDQRVYLKTLAGLNPVDVILRRLDDDFCDPLELRGDSLLGVPGLVQAARAGNVFIANCLGSGIVETPALMAFLPRLCRHILGEDLHMPSVATWWCGQDEPRQQVIDSLDRVVIKPAFPRFGQHAEFPATMSAQAREELAARLNAQARPVRRAGAGRSLDDAGAQPSRARASARGASRDCRVGRYVVRGAAGRPDARGHRSAVACRLDAARRRQQRHLGDGPNRASPDRTAARRSAGHLRQLDGAAPAASPTISSGWAGTPSVSRPRHASRVRSCQASRANRSRVGLPPSRRSCTSCAVSTCCHRSTGTR